MTEAQTATNPMDQEQTVTDTPAFTPEEITLASVSIDGKPIDMLVKYCTSLEGEDYPGIFVLQEGNLIQMPVLNAQFIAVATECVHRVTNDKTYIPRLNAFTQQMGDVAVDEKLTDEERSTRLMEIRQEAMDLQATIGTDEAFHEVMSEFNGYSEHTLAEVEKYTHSTVNLLTLEISHLPFGAIQIGDVVVGDLTPDRLSVEDHNKLLKLLLANALGNQMGLTHDCNFSVCDQTRLNLDPYHVTTVSIAGIESLRKQMGFESLAPDADFGEFVDEYTDANKGIENIHQLCTLHVLVQSVCSIGQWAFDTLHNEGTITAENIALGIKGLNDQVTAINPNHDFTFGHYFGKDEEDGEDSVFVFIQTRNLGRIYF